MHRKLSSDTSVAFAEAVLEKYPSVKHTQCTYKEYNTEKYLKSIPPALANIRLTQYYDASAHVTFMAFLMFRVDMLFQTSVLKMKRKENTKVLLYEY